MPYLIHEATSLHAQVEGNMKTKRMILSNELAATIKEAKNVLEGIADSSNTTDVTADWLYNLCELLDEVC